MPGSKYEREIRFIGRETVRLATIVDSIKNGHGSGDPEKDEKEVQTLLSRIEEMQARRKEIEDSYIAAGLELPLESRNLNASVYRSGASFEPVSNDYRLNVIAESRANSAAYVSAGDVDSDNIDELMAEVSLLSDQISAMERSIVEADLNDDMGEKVRLSEKATELRAHREDVLFKIKKLKTLVPEEKAKPEKVADDSRMDAIESECKSMKTQISILRDDMGDIKDQLRMLIEHFNLPL